MRPAALCVRDIHRPAAGVPVRGGAGALRDRQVRQDQQEPVEPLHAPVQLQHQQVPHRLHQVSSCFKSSSKRKLSRHEAARCELRDYLATK